MNDGFYIFINKEQEHALNVARNNGFPSQLIQSLKDTLTRKRQNGHNNTKTCVTFTYHSPLISCSNTLTALPALYLTSYKICKKENTNSIQAESIN